MESPEDPEPPEPSSGTMGRPAAQNRTVTIEYGLPEVPRALSRVGSIFCFDRRASSLYRATSFSRASTPSRGPGLGALEELRQQAKRTGMVKAFVVMAEALREHPIFLNVLKDQTVREFLRTILQKYKAEAKRVGVLDDPGITLKPNECAVCCYRGGEGLEVLPLQLDGPLLEELLLNQCPYPYVLTVVTSPEILVRREAAARAEREMQQRVAAYEEFVRAVAVRQQAVEQDELVARQAVARSALATFQELEHALIGAHYSELQEVVRVQRLRELQLQDDRVSDQRFFEALREQQRILAQQDAELRQRRGHRLQLALDAVVRSAQSRAELIRARETRHRGLLSLLHDEVMQRSALLREESRAAARVVLQLDEGLARSLLAVVSVRERAAIISRRNEVLSQLLRAERLRRTNDFQRRQASAIRKIVGEVETYVEQRAKAATAVTPPSADSFSHAIPGGAWNVLPRAATPNAAMSRLPGLRPVSRGCQSTPPYGRFYFQQQQNTRFPFL